MGIGVVARDKHGAFLDSCGEPFDEVRNPELEEGYPRVIFASDCQSVINRVNS
jgi:hypothetical protein